MTNLRKVTATQDIVHTDACGRLRVANMSLIYESRFNYGENQALFVSLTANGGTVTHNPDHCGFDLTTTTSAGSRARRMSARYLPQPLGRSMVMQVTGRFAPQKAGVASRIGWYDDEDGIFFERNENGIYAVKRSKVSGSVVETRVHQSQWNVDKLDGTGPSGLILNLDALQVVTFATAFAGAGGVFAGFTINKNPITAHYFVCANYVPTPIMRPVALPIQYEIINTGSVASPTSMFSDGLAVFSDGPYTTREMDARRYYVESGTQAVNISSTGWTPIISIKLASLRNGIKFRGNIIIEEFNVVVNGTNPIMWQTVLNPTLAGTPVWETPGSAPSSSLLQDRAASGYSGGIPLKFGYFGGGSSNQAKTGANSREADETPALAARPYGQNDILTFGGRAMSSGTSIFFSATYFETED